MKRSIQLGVVLLILSLVPLLAAQAKGKRLILKDGSYQIATKWEVKGDRVRYYSAERYMWEELPSSMVDWPATEKYESDRAAGKAADQLAMSAEAEAERKAEEARSPTIAPGLRLPETGGVFLLDQYQSHPQMVELVQNGSQINKQTGKNILRAVINPLPSGPKQTVELKGTRARIQSHTGTPSIYIDVNFDTDDDSQPATENSPNAKPDQVASAPLPANERFKIVRLQKKGDIRIVSNLKIALTGRVKEQSDLVNTISEAISSDWTKITPAVPLPPGEYAVIEMLGPKQMNIYVWDFGVDPNAPANASAWKPTPPPNTATGTNQSPVLENRPKR